MGIDIKKDGLSSLVDDTEELLMDIFLSGFHSIKKSVFVKLDQIIEQYDAYGMAAGAGLLKEMENQLILCTESFEGSAQTCMDAYGRVEFYLVHLENKCADLTKKERGRIYE